jgi:hypothetical protein
LLPASPGRASVAVARVTPWRNHRRVSVRARVHNGRLIVDEPPELPEGSVLDLVMDDEGDELDMPQRKALTAAIERSLDQAARGRSAPVEQVLQALALRRRG